MISLLQSIDQRLAQQSPNHIATPHPLAEPQVIEVEKIVEVEKVVEKAVEDEFSQSLKPLRKLLHAVLTDNELNSLILRNQSGNESIQFIRLIASASEWETVLDVWKTLADRCKQEKRPATPAELSILGHCVELYNLKRSKPAGLQAVEMGANFDIKQHQRGGSPTGNIVHALWLPALLNSKGEIIEPAVVETGA